MAHLANLHGCRLAQVGPHGVHDVDRRLLAALDAVGLHQLRAVLQRLRRDVLHSGAGRQAQVHVCRREIVHVEPHVVREPILD